MGRRFMWSLSLPLAAIGWLGGHSLAYVFVEPHGAHREELLAETGHSYLQGAPIIIACALTVILTGLVLAIHDGVRGRARAHVRVWPLSLLPPVGYAAQEHLERLIELNEFPVGVVLEPTFLVGIALQVPLGAAAFLIARAVLAFGHALGRRVAIGPAPRPCAWVPPASVSVPPDPVLARAPILAGGHGQRAPPSPAFV